MLVNAIINHSYYHLTPIGAKKNQCTYIYNFGDGQRKWCSIYVYNFEAGGKRTSAYYINQLMDLLTLLLSYLINFKMFLFLFRSVHHLQEVWLLQIG